jgi:hypothetical protein
MKASLPWLALLLASAGCHGAVVLIDGATRNGGFENPDGPQWSADVIDDADFAHGGSSYGSVTALRGVVMMTFEISNDDGHEFLFSFWARVPETGGYESLRAVMLNRVDDSTATRIPIEEPILTSGEWRQYTYRFETPEDWDDSGAVSFYVAFNSLTPPSTRTGYVDDVTLIQIPEPTTVSLLVGSLLGGLLRRRR